MESIGVDSHRGHAVRRYLSL